MKLHLLPAIAFLTVSIIPSFAGPPDAKDMKGMESPQMVSGDAGPYIGVFGGANVSQDYGNDRVDFTGAGGRFTYYGDGNSNHIGAVGGIKAGYNFQSIALFGNFRFQPATEIEAYYLGTKTDVHGTFGAGDDFDVRGNMNDGAFMVNSLIRLKTGTRFTPYIGIGAGTEFLTFTKPNVLEEGVGSLGGAHNANDFTPALQAIGGLDFEIAKHWDIFTEYKYLVAIDPSLDFGDVHFGGGAFNTKLDPYDLGQHIVTAGLKYNF